MLDVLAWIAVAALAPSQEGYKIPPKEVVELLDAPLPPATQLSPDTKWMLLVERPSMPGIADVARPWVGLAGHRIDPARNAPFRTSYDTGLVLRDLAGERERRIVLPEGARIGDVRWSHSSRRFAFTLAQDDRVELWTADVDSAAPKRLVERLSTVLGGFDWMPDGVRLLVTQVPAGRSAAPEAPRAPSGPTTMESAGRKSPVRTFQDLLEDEHDARLLEHFATSQLALVDARDGKTTPLGKPGLIAGFDPSPDGEHLLVATLHRPFSYVLTSDRFPRRTEVWSVRGQIERLVVDAPLQDTIPIEGVQVGPRGVQWSQSEPATLVWVEALDGGDPKNEAEHRDRWLAHPAPFTAEPRELFRVEHRARGLSWFADPKLVLASEYDRDRRWTRSTLRDLSTGAAIAVLEDRSVNDRYGSPGAIVSETRADGTRVARQSGEWVYRAGEGEGPEGARPFVDRQNLSTRATERLWRCDEGLYESLAAVASVDANGLPTIVTRRETPVEPPNLWLRDLGAQGATEKSVTQLTRFPDPQPSIRGITKELVRYPRADGVELSATLYLPAGYVAGTRLPVVVWAYPMEFNDPATAGQVGGTPHRFTTVRGTSHLLFLTQGYAVLDNATMPIVGDPETMNDTFVDQITASAKAAIDFVASRGVGDPDRVGVGGHSYGAFMTANLLAHTDLFRAGCARSGAYNRTLTPFGFQSERRTLWEATPIYEKLSPFFFAHRINEPLLLIHGEKDSNPGTFPMQSERLYQAIAGNGGAARLVILPEENHGYSARESVLHTVAEMFEWFDRHVKGAKVAVEAASAGGAAR